MIEIYQLKYFKEITRTMNYTRAAESLHLTRQALTKAIRRMEEDLGGKIFDVSDHALILTPLGRKLLQESDPVLEAYDSFEKAMFPSDTAGRRLSIIFSTGASLSLPSNILSDFHAQNPRISISAEETTSDATARAIARGSADIGLIGSLPEYLTEFDTILVRRTGTYLRVPNGHPLYDRQELFLEDLRDVPLVTAGQRNHLQRYLEDECWKAGFSPTFALMTSDVNMLTTYARENKMLNFAFPAHIVPPDNPDDRILPLRLPRGDEVCTYAIRRKDRRPSDPARRFWEYLKTIPSPKF